MNIKKYLFTTFFLYLNTSCDIENIILRPIKPMVRAVTEIFGDHYYGRQRLKPKNEKFVKDIMKILGMESEQIGVYKSNHFAIAHHGYNNAFAVGFLNSIFISEGFFEELSFNEKVFLIGHELSHLKKNHSYKKASLILGKFCFWWYFNDQIESFIKEKLKTTRLAGWTKETNYIFSKIFAGISCLGFLAYSRICEYDADKTAVVNLGNVARNGGLGMFKSFKEKEDETRDSFLFRLLSTHPSHEQRIEVLKKIKIPKTINNQELSRIYSEYEKNNNWSTRISDTYNDLKHNIKDIYNILR